MKKLLCTLLAIISAGISRGAEADALAQPAEKLAYEKVVVWTPLFQAAWDELHRGLGVPVKIDPPNSLMDRLDRFEWKAETVMPLDHWKVWAGSATKDLIDKANAEAAQMLGEKKGLFQIEVRPNARIVLGFLDRDLVFKKARYRSTIRHLLFQATDGTKSEVQFFGTRGNASDNFSEMVKVLAYKAGSHALQIDSDAGDAAVIYLSEKPMTFSDACAQLREWKAKKLAGAYGSVQDPKLHTNDDVKIPVLKLTNTTDFVPLLEGLRYFGTAGEAWHLLKAEQRLKFELTEKGAKLRVKVDMSGEPFGEPPPPPADDSTDFSLCSFGSVGQSGLTLVLGSGIVVPWKSSKRCESDNL